MFTALTPDDMHVGASWAARGVEYRCPGCTHPVVLRRGEVLAAHFAHKRESSCRHGSEDQLRQVALELLSETFRSRGWGLRVNEQGGAVSLDMTIQRRAAKFAIKFLTGETDFVTILRTNTQHFKAGWPATIWVVTGAYADRLVAHAAVGKPQDPWLAGFARTFKCPVLVVTTSGDVLHADDNSVQPVTLTGQARKRWVTTKAGKKLCVGVCGTTA